MSKMNSFSFFFICSLPTSGQYTNGSGGGLSTQQLVAMGLQIVQGMQYLHKRKILHKDLATRNVLWVDLLLLILLLSILPYHNQTTILAWECIVGHCEPCFYLFFYSFLLNGVDWYFFPPLLRDIVRRCNLNKFNITKGSQSHCRNVMRSWDDKLFQPHMRHIICHQVCQ